jgi:uncharacterized membrane protein YdbT with pleckstrin-like domain
MFCYRCGNEVRANGHYCELCGAAMHDSPPELEEEDEKVVFRVQPVLATVTVSYTIATLLSLATAVIVGHFSAPFWVVLAAAAIFFVTPVIRHLQRSQVSYTLTHSRIEVESGLWSKKTRNIPLRNVQDVTAQASLAERLVGIGEVVIDSATDAARIRMTNVRDPRKYSSLILYQMHRGERWL